MAINVSFNGATIYKPGAYSKVSIDLGGGFPLSPTGLIAIFGESDAGTPGSDVPNIADNVFSPEQLPLIKQTYRDGPLVDACNFLFAPGADGAIPGGAQAVYIYKTNASDRATLSLANSWGTVRAREWGTGGNKLTYKNVLVPATPATTQSSATFNLTAGAFDGETLVLRLLGAGATSDNTFTTPVAVAATATLNLTADITLTSAATGPARNTTTFTLQVAPAAANPTDTVLANFTGTSAAIVCTITPNDGTNNAATPVDLTTAELAELINTGAVVGKTVTVTDGSSLRALQTASGGDTTPLADGGEGDGVVATFSGGYSTNTRALLQTAFTTGGNWSGGLPSGITFTVSGSSDAAALLTITQGTSGSPWQEGYGRNFELVSGTALGTGAGKFNIATGLYVSSAENQSIITISNKRDLVDETGTMGGNIVMKVGRTGGVNPKVTINATQILLINNSLSEYALNTADFGSLNELTSYIASSTSGNWSAALTTALYGQLNPSVLDHVTNVGAQASSLSASALPAQIKKDASEVVAFFAQASSVDLVASTGAVVGLPDAASETFLAGGALGATATADISNALAKFQKVRVNSVVPLFSRDSTADIADQLTDLSSSYTILGIHQAVKTHCSLMASTKKKSERQGYLSMKDTYDNCKVEAQNMADARQQLVIQDVRQTNSDGAIQWFQPWAAACLLAGARGGSPIGLPMTGKYFNMSGIRQTAQSMSTAEEDIVIDFDPDTQFDDAIANGITFWEHPQTGGFRMVVDNTTYGKDANWVYNRANVLYAADVLAFDFRSQMENIYVGVKNTVSAAEVKSTAESILATYLAQGITVSTQDAKNGFKQLVVQINGNVINISLVVKLVEGIDFILNDITLQRATSSA